MDYKNKKGSLEGRTILGIILALAGFFILVIIIILVSKNMDKLTNFFPWNWW